MILVVGGTSRLGAIVVPALVAEGHKVRVLTRDATRADHLPVEVERVIGDARDEAALRTAIDGCTTVISSMHGFVGDRGISPESVDRDANRALIRAAKSVAAEHFVLVSVQGASADHPMSLHRAKFAAELALRASGIPFTIIRPTSFMETWMSVIGETLDKSGVALVFGKGRNPINFVSVRDVGALVTLAVREPALRGQTLEIGGPANLDFSTFADRLIAASGKAARIKRIPLAVLRAMSVVARPFSPQFARQARAAVVMNREDFTFADEVRARFPSVPSTTLEDLLASRRLARS